MKEIQKMELHIQADVWKNIPCCIYSSIKDIIFRLKDIRIYCRNIQASTLEIQKASIQQFTTFDNFIDFTRRQILEKVDDVANSQTRATVDQRRSMEKVFDAKEQHMLVKLKDEVLKGIQENSVTMRNETTQMI